MFSIDVVSISRQAGRQASWQPGMLADRQIQIGRQAGQKIGGQASRQTSRQAGKQIGREAGTLACRQTGPS